MGDLEQRGEAECFGEIRADARKHEVVQENIALHLPRNVLNGTRIGQPQLLSAFCKRPEDIGDARDDRVGFQERERYFGCGRHGRDGPQDGKKGLGRKDEKKTRRSVTSSKL